ncbi:DUF2218 domain-containing protein [Comamonas flocculans]|uniref:DUF2218 domain-containing protein n=1 Tax=Comamonas flocculans TaxID=2597701 RepID=A0A5B8RVA7_9BURK|nr:DUF2218 domain-containing protein [Comamonas flocculans]QEA13053.1 DUF2218 domain-containing protein [Comamonas flocculans]
MNHTHGHVATTEASRWLQRLCYHFNRKISVQYSAFQGHARFPWGQCELRADDEALHFACSAPDPEALARVCAVIDEHLRLFSRKNPLAVQWQELPPTSDTLDIPDAH